MRYCVRWYTDAVQTIICLIHLPGNNLCLVMIYMLI